MTSRGVARGASARCGGEGMHEEELAPRLHHLSIDPEHVMELYLADQLPSALADLLASNRTFGYLAAATPGMRELLTVGKVWELAQDERRAPGAQRYDLVVLDAPATGHGVAVLSAPRTFARTARVGRIARQGRTIDAMLCDPERTGVIAVAAPEEMPVNETVTLQDALRDELGTRDRARGLQRDAAPALQRRRGRQARRGARRTRDPRGASRPCAGGRAAIAAAAPAPPGARLGRDAAPRLRRGRAAGHPGA